MNILIDQTYNSLWHRWTLSSQSDQFVSRIVKAAGFAIASLCFASLSSLRNRVCSTPLLTDAQLKHEFSNLTVSPTGVTFNSATDHPYDNRYIDVQPFDHTRVKLKDSDQYYNASWVLGGRAIAAQGPLTHQIETFWDLVWENNPSLLAMVTDLYEKGTEKCACYWIREVGKYRIEQLSATTLSERSSLKIIKREFRITRGDKKRIIPQFQLVGWPDHQGVDLNVLKDFVQMVNAELKPSQPLLAHCSAGVGRTGTLLSILEAIRTKSKRLLPIVDALRHERCWMVQRPQQYILAQRVLEQLT